MVYVNHDRFFFRKNNEQTETFIVGGLLPRIQNILYNIRILNAIQKI